MNTSRIDRRRVLACLFLVTFYFTFDAAATETSFPRIAAQLGGSLAQSAWMVSAYYWGATVPLLLFGNLGDRLPRWRLYVTGTVLFTLVAVALPFAPNIEAVIAARALQGVASAMVVAVSPGLLLSFCDDSERERAFGWVAMATALGLLLGPACSGLMFERFGWQGVFALTSFAGVPLALGTYAVLRHAPDTPPEVQGPFDWRGALSLAVLLTALLLAIAVPAGSGLPSAAAAGLAALAALAVAGIWHSHRHHVDPVLDLQFLCENSAFTLANLASTVSFTGAFMVGFIMPYYCVSSLALPPSASGILLATFPLGFLLGAPVGAWFGRRHGGLAAMVTAQAVIVTGSLGLMLLSARTELAGVAAATVFAGFGRGLFVGPFGAYAISLLPAYRRGIGGGLMASARHLGMLLGMAAAGAMFTHGMAGGPAPSFHGAEQALLRFDAVMDTVLWTATAMAVLSLLLFVLVAWRERLALSAAPR